MVTVACRIDDDTHRVLRYWSVMDEVGVSQLLEKIISSFVHGSPRSNGGLSRRLRLGEYKARGVSIREVKRNVRAISKRVKRGTL